MIGVNEIVQSAPTVKVPTTTTVVIDAAPTVPVSPPIPIPVEQEQKIRQQDAAAAGKQNPLLDKSEPTAAKDEQVMQVLQVVRDYAQSIERDLKFNVDGESGRLVITVIDPETDKVVRQIPPEETLYILRNMERGGGALFDNKA